MFKRNTFSIVMILIGILTLIPPMVQGQDDSGSTVAFEINDIPVVYRGERGEWDQNHTAPGAVFFHDGLFHMFRNGYHPWPSPSQVGYMISEDGMVWTEVVEDPVFLHEQIPFNVDLALVSSGFVEDDGTWVLYFYMIPNQDPDSPSGVARATADNPLGPWEITQELILLPGSEGEWDSGSVGSPHVLRMDDGSYRLYYNANMTGMDDSMFGMAISDDGLNWTKYDDPVTTDAPFAESDPIFFSEAEWEGVILADPSAFETSDGFVMFYGSYDPGFTSGAIGYGIATSEDGISWERISDEAIIRRTMVGYRQTWYSKLMYHNGTYYVYIEANSRYGTDIFGGTYTGSLRP